MPVTLCFLSSAPVVCCGASGPATPHQWCFAQMVLLTPVPSPQNKFQAILRLGVQKTILPLESKLYIYNMCNVYVYIDIYIYVYIYMYYIRTCMYECIYK